MSTVVIETPRVETAKWIIGKRDDLIWFIGSALLGYFLLALLAGAPQSRSVGTSLAFVWTVLISGPHFFATASRTYFDADSRKKLGGFLWLIIPLALAPVLLSLVGLGKPLFVFGMAWGTYHITKQHFGIMMLYKRVNKEFSKTDFKIDTWFLKISQCLPLALYLLWYLNLQTDFLFKVALGIQIVLAVAYLGRQIQKYNRETMNWPKLMLLALVIPLHWFAVVVALKDIVSGIFLFTIATNVGHSLQYHRLTWFHNKNRYAEKTGLSSELSRSPLYYYGAALCLYLFFVGVTFLLPTRGNDLLLTGPIFMHYLLDAKIWRVREDPELAKALRL